MKRRFAIKPIIQLMCIGGLLATGSNASAAAFQLWEQDAASLGNYHAGRAAIANDASTAFYNPAGITRLHNQQIILGSDVVLSDIKFNGTVGSNTLGPVQRPAIAQGGAFSKIPFFHYVAPVNETFGVGLSFTAPFGLKTDYGRTSAVRYSATKTELRVVDLSPSFGLSLSKQFSIGAGLDAERMGADFNQDSAVILPNGAQPSANAFNKGWSTAYGYHVGALFQSDAGSRIGLTYNSRVAHHLHGNSKFVGSLANLLNAGNAVVASNTRANLTLPAYTTLSLFQSMNPSWAMMGTVVYTQWRSALKNLVLSNAAGIAPGSVPSNTITVSIPEYYRNTWNLALGAEFYTSEKMTLRTGVGYDQSPSNPRYRNLQVPDANRYAVALGGHYQATKSLGFDLGWTHLFMAGNNTVNPPPQAVGAKVVTVNGKVTAGADIFGAQVVWDIV